MLEAAFKPAALYGTVVKGSIYIRNVRYNSFYLESVYLPTNHMSHQTQHQPCRGVIGSVPSPPVVANPKHFNP
jgi:hypothetical protein